MQEDIGVRSSSTPLLIGRLPILQSPLGMERLWREDDFVKYFHEPDTCEQSGGEVTAVLFEADLTSNRAMISSSAMGFGNLAAKADWQHVIEAIFHREGNVRALLTFSQRAKKKVDLFIALPYPYEQQSHFGRVHHSSLDFTNSPTARLLALRWWVEEVCSRWRECRGEVMNAGVRMKGFFWSRGWLWGNDKEVVKLLAETVHNQGLEFLWCRNQECEDEELEQFFDVTVIRPEFQEGRRRAFYNFDKTVCLQDLSLNGEGDSCESVTGAD